VLTVLVKNPLMTTREVVRGYTGTYTCPKEDEYEHGRLLPIHHVIFVLHGIGEAVWSRSTCCKYYQTSSVMLSFIVPCACMLERVSSRSYLTHETNEGVTVYSELKPLQ
jgi:hypothetical protein